MSRLGLTRTRPRRYTAIAGAGLGAVGLILIVLAAAGVFSAGPSTFGQVKLVTTTTAAPAATASPPAPNSQTDPFGAPSGGPDYTVPPPPGQPTLVPTYGTKSTQRLYGENPFEEAVSVTQHVWTSALPENAPNENNNVPDRPWGLTLLTPDDPLTAITALPLLHFPNDAPVLYVTRNGIPEVTANEKIENPDTGVPNMDNGAENVMVGSMQSYRYMLPATHWVGHMPEGLLWVNANSVPEATIDALERRNGQARIYVFGGPQQISGAVVRQLSRYGTVMRVTNDDTTDFNAPQRTRPWTRRSSSQRCGMSRVRWVGRSPVRATGSRSCTRTTGRVPWRPRRWRTSASTRRS